MKIDILLSSNEESISIKPNVLTKQKPFRNGRSSIESSSRGDASRTFHSDSVAQNLLIA